jgi:hypothetical protein
MIKAKEDLNLKVKNARLLTREELAEYEDQLPDIDMGCAWWLADEDDYGDIAYAEGNYSDEDMYCSNNEANTWLRVVLEIVGDVEVGDEFVHCGYVFTALSKNLAISNNFLGCAKYMDEELLPYVANPETECTIGAVISTMIHLGCLQ